MKLLQFRFNENSAYSNYDSRMCQLNKEDFCINLSKQLGLLMIKGNLSSSSCQQQVNVTLPEIKKLLLDREHLSVYINLSKVNTKGLGKLLKIINILTELQRQGKEIDVYWNTQNDSQLTEIAENFGALLFDQLMITDF
ncbi:MAG: SiaC family regulatory phosphoprotein [Bacteroidota bacterium]